MPLDVYDSPKEFDEINAKKPLDYQQQIDLYKKYTELKRNPKIVQTESFNHRLSIVAEKTLGAKVFKAFQEQLKQQQAASTGNKVMMSDKEEVKTSALEEKKPSKKEKKTSKSQSTNDLDNQSPRGKGGGSGGGESNNLNHRDNLHRLEKNKPNRAVSNSPPRRDHDDSSPKTATENAEKKHKSNGFIKRLSLRLKSHSIDHPESSDTKKSKKDKEMNDKSHKSKKEASYPEKHNHINNKDKAHADRASSQNANIDRLGRNEYGKSNSSDQLSSINNRYDNSFGSTSKDVSYKIIKVRLDRERDYSNDESGIDIQTMKKVFDLFDRDHDGSITIEDVQEVMKSLNFLQEEIEMPTLDQIKESFEKFDENKNGRIEFNEFLNIEKSAVASMPYDPEISRSVYLYPPPPSSPPRQNLSSAPPVQFEYENQNFLSANPLTFARSVSNYSNQSGDGGSGSSTGGDLIADETMHANMKLIFEQFDKDNDGRITRAELNFVMSNLFPDEVITTDDIDNMLKAADLDRNGFIDFDEFSQMFNLYGKSVSEGNLDSIVGGASETAQARSPPQQSSTTSKPYKSLFKQHSKSSTRDEGAAVTTTTATTAAATTSVSSSNNNKKSSSRDNVSLSPVRSNSSNSSNSVGTRKRVSSNPSNYKKVVQIFTASQLMDLKAAFTMFDKNGDQKISESELYEVMKYLGVKTTPEECRAMIKVVDKNKNGYVDYDEFIQMMTHTQIKPLSAEEELKKTFEIFDIDGNGFISADEIKKTMHNIGEPLTDDEVRDMIKAADRNGDGKIDLNEFSGLLTGTNAFKSDR